jgi:hypothetical protein
MAGLLGAIVALTIIAAIWLRIAAPARVEFTGERATRSYDYADFTAVAINGQWRATLERGDAWRVTVDVPAEIEDRVRVERVADGLTVEYVDGWSFGGFGRDTEAPQVSITMPALESVALAGASTLSFNGFEGERLALTTSGASEVRGSSGRYDTLTLQMSGAGNVDLYGLLVTNAEIQAAGAGNLKLEMAGGRLTGNMSGAGNLDYRGTVSEQSVATSGFVTVRQRD